MLQALIVGDADRPEMRLALNETATWQRASDVRAARRMIAAGRCAPDVLVIVQSYSGQIAPADVEELRRLCPLARLVGLLGSWCEGEMRSGRPLPGALRVHWHQWPLSVPPQMESLALGLATPWTLPPTATDEERILAQSPAVAKVQGGRALVVGGHREMANLLASACRAWGFLAEVVAPGAIPRMSADVVLFDTDELAAAALAQLGELAARTGGAPIVVLANFPRLPAVASALAAGAAIVLGKPVDMDDLGRLVVRHGATFQSRGVRCG